MMLDFLEAAKSTTRSHMDQIGIWSGKTNLMMEHTRWSALNSENNQNTPRQA